MKKLFTLVALLTFFMGAKAANWVEVYKIDYSNNTGFPFYVMGYVPEWFDGVMTDFGANYAYVQVTDDAEETSDVIVTTQGGVEYYKCDRPDGSWHQYFIADGIPTQLDGHYKAVAMARASEPVTVTVNMGWGWGEGQQMAGSVSIGTEWEEVEWEYSGIGGASCNLVAQPGGATATIEWKYVTVYEDQKAQKPIVWQEWLTNDGHSIIPGEPTESVYMGDAETPWGDLSNVRFDDQDKNYLICAWSKEKGRNLNDDDGWDPFPADIEVDPDDPNNHIFVCHGQPATTAGDASAWDNQFWIQSPQPWKAGTQLKIHFRYKASAPVSSTDTQIHNQNPSNYLIWHAIGNIAFTTEWQDFDGTMTIADDMANGWSIAFNLNSVVKDAVTFYFDDLSWKSMVLDEGLFLASSNTTTGLEYDFDNAIELEYDAELDAYVGVAGELGNQDSWVNELMISTTRGNDAAFKGATIKPSGSYIGEEEWGDYTASSLAKIKLPAAGVWQVAVDTEQKQINIVKLEGEKDKEPLEEIANPTEVIVKGVERDWLTADNDGNPREDQVGEGQTWDNQFFILANRELSKGESTILKFKYKSSIPAKTTTQCHVAPGAYKHWGAIGDVNFTEDWQEFDQVFTVADAADGMKSIAFNMAEIKEACDYYIKDVIWMTEDHMETLIDTEGTKNFYVKVGAGTDPHEFVGINSILNDSKVATVTYNIAGQRVTAGYKGIVVKNGQKLVVK